MPHDNLSIIASGICQKTAQSFLRLCLNFISGPKTQREEKGSWKKPEKINPTSNPNFHCSYWIVATKQETWPGWLSKSVIRDWEKENWKDRGRDEGTRNSKILGSHSARCHGTRTEHCLETEPVTQQYCWDGQTKGQAGRSFEHPGLVEVVPTHGRGSWN